MYPVPTDEKLNDAFDFALVIMLSFVTFIVSEAKTVVILIYNLQSCITEVKLRVLINHKRTRARFAVVWDLPRLHCRSMSERSIPILRVK